MSTPGHQVLKAWRENPVRFVNDVFKVDPDEWQKDALMSMVKGDRVQVSVSPYDISHGIVTWRLG